MSFNNNRIPNSTSPPDQRDQRVLPPLSNSFSSSSSSVQAQLDPNNNAMVWNIYAKDGKTVSPNGGIGSAGSNSPDVSTIKNIPSWFWTMIVTLTTFFFFFFFFAFFTVSCLTLMAIPATYESRRIPAT